jgi:hypothetical protein
MNTTTKILSAVLVSSVISGCGIGQKKVLFTTRTNIGLDVDAKQFTAQINIDRQEAVIGPTFEGGQHVPITAAFRNNSKLLGGFGVSSLFAGGDAALALTTTPKANLVEGESLIPLSEPPQYHKGLIGRFFNLFKDKERIEQEKYLPGPGQVTPFIFDTDTSLGIKLAWTGAAAEFPDKVKIGFNREEFALAPVIATKNAVCMNSDKKEVPCEFAEAKQTADASKKLAEEISKNADLTKETNQSKINLEEATKQLEEQAQEKAAANPTNTKLQDNEKQAVESHNRATSDSKKWNAQSIEADKQASIAETNAAHELKNAYSVGVPSFFAAIDSNSQFKLLNDTDIGFRQVFAAGKSATNLANNPDIRNIIKARFGLNDINLCLTEWLSAGTTNADIRNNNDRAKALKDWLGKNDFAVTTVNELANNPFAWQDFASKNISPGLCQKNP